MPPLSYLFDRKQAQNFAQVSSQVRGCRHVCNYCVPAILLNGPALICHGLPFFVQPRAATYPPEETYSCSVGLGMIMMDSTPLAAGR